MPDCPGHDQLQRLLAEELSPAERADVQGHLERCPACRQFVDRELESAGRIAAALAALPKQCVQRLAPGAGASGPPFAVPDYDLLRPLGKGAFGEVWLGRNQSTGAHYAVKLISLGAAIRLEMDALRLIERFAEPHPSRLEIRHVGRTAGGLFYVMPLADNYGKRDTFSIDDYWPRTLRGDLRRRGKLAADDAVQVTLAVLDGVASLHANGLLHRDLKPENIVYLGGVPRIADIGLVASVTGEKSSGGTPAYAPPEGVTDHSGDLYCVGRMLHEMLAGRLPIGSDVPVSLQQLADSVDERTRELAGVVQKATAVDREQRFQAVHELVAELQPARISSKLEQAVAPIAAGATPGSAHEEARLRSGLRRRVRLLALVGLGAAVLLAGIALPSLLTPPALAGQLDILVEDRAQSVPPRKLTEADIPLRPGQRIKLRATFNRPAHAMLVIVTRIASATKSQVVHPVDGSSVPTAEVIAPAGTRVWELDPAPAMIAFVLLVSDRPDTPNAALLAALERAVQIGPGDYGCMYVFDGSVVEARRNPKLGVTKDLDATRTVESAWGDLWRTFDAAKTGVRVVRAIAVPQVGE